MSNRWFNGRVLTVALLFGLSVFQPMASSAVQALNPGAGEKASTCTLATLKGRYLFAHSGTILPPAFGVKEPTPGADVGFHIFNGDGTGTDIVTQRVGGEIALKNFVVPFKYKVNADCTGSYAPEIPGGGGPAFDLYIAPNGEEFVNLGTVPSGNYVAGIDRRVSLK